jgi:putative transcriptional regulator
MANRIKEFRERKGINQAELARRLGISRSYLNKLENGKSDPSIRLAVRIAQALDTTLNDIFLP